MPFTPPPLDSIESEPSGFKPPPLTSEEKPNGFKPPPIEAIEQPDMFTGRSLRAAPGYANKGKRLPGGTRVPAVVPIEEQYGPEPEKEFSFEKYLGDEMFSPENVQKMFNKQHSTYTYIPGQTLGTGKPESPVETPTGQAQLVSGVASNVGATLDFFKSPVGITSTLLGASVPAWVIRLVGGAIVANALRKTPQFVVSVGDELAKPPENRDVKKLSSEGAGLVTDFLFGGTMGFRPGMARDIPKLNEVLTKSITEEYPPQVLRDMVRRVDIQDAEIKAAQDSGRPIDSTVPTATQEERDIITFIENELGGKSAKGEISKHGAVITSSEPRIESEFWRKYLGLEPSTKTATVIGGPNAIDKIFVNQGVPSERPRTLPRQLIEGVGEEAQPGADIGNRISDQAGEPTQGPVNAGEVETQTPIANQMTKAESDELSAVAFEPTDALVGRTNPGAERDKAFSDRAAALKRVALSLKVGDMVIDEDGVRRTVADVTKDGTVFLAKPGATGDAATGSAFKLTVHDTIERSSEGQPTPPPSPSSKPAQPGADIGNRISDQAGVGSQPVAPVEEAKPTAITAKEILSRPMGSTSPEEMSSLSEPEMHNMIAGMPAAKYSMTVDATKWALAHPDADPKAIEMARQQMLARGGAIAPLFSQWFGDAIHALTKTDRGLQNIASVTGKPISGTSPVVEPTKNVQAVKTAPSGQSKIEWLKTPSVTPGGKPYFWNAYRGEAGKGMPFMRVVWNRSNGKWSITDPNQPDKNGRSKELASFEKEKDAKSFVEKYQPPPPHLTPALLVNGKPIPGGPHHKDIVDALVKADDPRAADAVVAADSDKNHVFVDEQGNVLDRKKAAVKFDQMRGNKPGTTKLLHSEDLTPAPAQPAAGKTPSLEYIKSKYNLTPEEQIRYANAIDQHSESVRNLVSELNRYTDARAELFDKARNKELSEEQVFEKWNKLKKSIADRAIEKFKKKVGEGAEVTWNESNSTNWSESGYLTVDIPVGDAEENQVEVLNQFRISRHTRSDRSVDSGKGRMLPDYLEEPPIIATPPSPAPAKAAGGLTQSERDFGESLAKKYGAPVSPVVPATEPQESISRFGNMLERAADKSKEESELAQILSAAKGNPEESRIAWAVANNAHSSDETFSQAKSNPVLRSMTTDENIARLDTRRAELRKQLAAPETKAVTAKDIGYRTEKAFKRDFEKNSLKQYNETEPEFMTRRHCLESVPKRKGVLSE